MASVTVQLQHVLNLTIGEVRQTLRVGEQRIRDDDWRAQQDAGNESLTQAIGRAAKEAGLEGLLVPSSARRHGVNLVFFPENRQPRSQIDPVNKDELPPPFPRSLPPSGPATP